MNALDVLKSLERGQFAEQIGEELEALVTAVRHTGRKGTITITLGVKPSRPNDDHNDELQVESAIKTAPPQPDKGTTIMYATGKGLSRKDPRQIDMESLPQFSSADREDG